MTIHIIGCGDSAKYWNGEGFSIGCNDAFKFGHKINWLVVVNHFLKFSKEPDRIKVILKSNPDRFLSHSTSWKEHRPDMQQISMTWYNQRVKKGIIYHTQTSPFVAMSLAFNHGATNIILWGVDFVNHAIFHPGGKHHQIEIDHYVRFSTELNRQGTKVFIGHESSYLAKYIPVWKKEKTTA